MAGREHEKAVLLEGLGGLVARATSLRGIAMYGPRGMDKTVLMYWFARECAAKKVTVINTTPTQALSSRSALADTLFPWTLGIKELGLSLERFTLNIGLRAGATRNLGRKIISTCRKKPMALLMDEAHIITEEDTALCRDFLQACQQAGAESPFLPVLVGTPGLPSALSELNATFIGRALSLDIGLLAAEEAAAAIREPLAAAGIQIDDDALQTAVEDSQRYPFFLQLWGKYLWDLAKEGGVKQLTVADVQRAHPAVEKERITMYEGRYDELRKTMHLEAVAGAVAEAFCEQQAISKTTVFDIVQAALASEGLEGQELHSSALALHDELVRLGFVWKLPGQPKMQPGIPSLLDYTLAQAQQP